MRLEQSIYVATAFFAALIGFGLQNILDVSETSGQQPDDLVTQKWPIFIIAVLFFLRFLLGSANHLWLEYIHSEEIDPTPVERQSALITMVTRDIGFLIVFGIFAAAMLYADTVEGFLVRASVFLAVAFFWTMVAVANSYIRHRISRHSSNSGNWKRWAKMDFVQFACFMVAWFLISCETGGELPLIKMSCEPLSLGYLPVSGWSLTLSLLILASAVILAWDFVFQLREISKTSVSAPSEERSSPRSP